MDCGLDISLVFTYAVEFTSSALHLFIHPSVSRKRRRKMHEILYLALHRRSDLGRHAEERLRASRQTKSCLVLARWTGRWPDEQKNRFEKIILIAASPAEQPSILSRPSIRIRLITQSGSHPETRCNRRRTFARRSFLARLGLVQVGRERPQSAAMTLAWWQELGASKPMQPEKITPGSVPTSKK